MQKLDERTLKMMENYVALHEAGFGVPEIAKRYNLSETTVYRKLGEIAKRAGVTRKELLTRPFEADHSGQNYTQVKPVDPAKFQENYSRTMADISALQKSVVKSIADLEKAE